MTSTTEYKAQRIEQFLNFSQQFFSANRVRKKAMLSLAQQIMTDI
jgi:hypothetical protein